MCSMSHVEWSWALCYSMGVIECGVLGYGCLRWCRGRVIVLMVFCVGGDIVWCTSICVVELVYG